MTTFTVPPSWSFALQNSQHIPVHDTPDALELWLKQKTPHHQQQLQSPTPFLLQTSPSYPAILMGRKAPYVLFYRGNLDLLTKRRVAVVGTRKCSAQGITYTQYLAQHLYEHDIVSVSGLAYGIDEVVHKYSYAKTIGIMPCGFGAKLPQRTEELCSKIVREGGLLLSEFPPYTPARKWRFIQRNRIIAWIAHALVLVEAPLESGALHTVRFAQQRNKKIWVVPSSPLTYSNHGGLALISSGFEALCHIDQLMLYFQMQSKQTERPQSVMSFSEFAQHLNMNTKQAVREINKLELAGKLTSLPNGYYAWNPY